MKLSLITINYNRSDLTIKLLESLKANIDQNFEIIVVDNCSEKTVYENITSYISENYPKVQLIRSEENKGFSGGNNLGLAQAFSPAGQEGQNGSEWAFLINNDTWVEMDFISHLKAVLEAKSGIIGFPLVEGEETAYGGRVEWLKSTLSHNYKHILKDQEKDHYAIGGALAISKEAYKKIGGLDEKYFLYFEDADYTLTAKKKGIDVSFSENPKLNHTVSSTTKTLGLPLLLRYHFRNALYFNNKHGDQLLTSVWALVIFIKQIIKILLRKNSEHSRAILQGVLDYWLSRMGKIEK